MVLSRQKNVITSLGHEDWRKLTYSLDAYGRGGFKINLRDSNFTTQVQRITVIVTEDEVVAVGLARSLGSSGDLDTAVAFSNVHLLETTPLTGIAETLHLHPHSTAAATFRTGGILPPVVGQKFFDHLSRLIPEFSSILERLRNLRDPQEGEVTDQRRLVEEQRDAVALALEVAGIDSLIALTEGEAPPGDAPFLAGLSFRGTSEASLIRHDATHFEEWLPSDGAIHDVTEFVDQADPNRKMTVAYVDKEPLEHTTGTDLIYYRHHNPGYVLVQYKRMKRSADEAASKWLYRPDKQLSEEIRRMREVELGVTGNGVAEWRLSDEPFYMKLCEDEMSRSQNGRLVRGMYFPLALFEVLLESPKILGPKGGKGIGWHNAERWLSNTSFIGLLREGWIGSTGDVTEQITSLIQNSLDGKRGVILARDDSSVSYKARGSFRRT